MLIFAERLTKLRKEHKLSQQELAKRIEISQAMISHYEKNNFDVTGTNLKRIAQYFHVTSDYLLGLSEE